MPPFSHVDASSSRPGVFFFVSVDVVGRTFEGRMLNHPAAQLMARHGSVTEEDWRRREAERDETSF